MADTKADLIFHPVRIRIVQALFGNRKLTAHQIATALHGPSLATLYRHLNRLLDGGIVAVVEERRIRGTVEKIFALAHDAAADIETGELRESSPKDQLRHFAILTGTLLNDFAQHLEHDPLGWANAATFLRQEALYLTNEEVQEVRNAFMAALMPFLPNLPTPSRRRHLLTAILLPVIEAIETNLE